MLSYFIINDSEVHTDNLLKHVFRYGDPILVVAETIGELKKTGQLSQAEVDFLFGTKLWLAVLTVRTLFAHSIFMDEKADILFPLIATIRNLLRSIGIDISDKEAFRELENEEKVYLKALNPPTEKKDGT